jgi:hypothetical protein
MLFDPTRETRERWPLLIVETEANWNSRRAYERGPSLSGSLGSSCRNKRFCPPLAAIIDLVQNIFFLPVHFFMQKKLGDRSGGEEPNEINAKNAGPFHIFIIVFAHRSSHHLFFFSSNS